MSLGDIINAVFELRSDMRAAGATTAEIEKATERSVRSAWPSTPIDEWPGWAQALRCAYCDGTGLVIHRNVKNRLGVLVDEGTPCRCPLGAKFLPPAPKDDDFQEAGKTTKPKRGFSRFGR